MNKNKFQTFWGYKRKKCRQNLATIGKKLRTSSEHFEAKKEIAAP